MRILAFVCLFGIGCGGGTTTSHSPESKPATELKDGTTSQTSEPKEGSTETKTADIKENLAEKQKARIEQAMLECGTWEKAVQVYQLEYGSYPVLLKDAAKYVKDGKDKLNSPWGTPYLMEFDPLAVLPEMRITTTTDDRRVVSKQGVEKK